MDNLPQGSEEAVTETPREVVGEPPTGESFGTWLRQQREMREIHLSEIADRTKISLRYLRAMEQDNFDLLPGAVFVKGFLREYAKYVGLNPDEVVNFYLSTQADPEDTLTEPIERESSVSRPWGRGLLLAVLGILLLAIASYLIFAYLARQRDQVSEQAPPFGAPAPLPAAAVEPVEPAASAETQDVPAEPAVPLTVTLDFSEDCWVEVVVDRVQQVDKRFVQGESLTLPAQESVELRALGNPQGVSVQVNGNPFPLEFVPGRVLRDLRIDLETARQLAGGGLRNDTNDTGRPNGASGAGDASS